MPMTGQKTLTAGSERTSLDRRRRARRGVTLVELLVVLVILGLLVGVVGPRVIAYLGTAKSDTARVQIEQLAAALDLYLIDVGRYPTESEGLAALVEAPSALSSWNGPYLEDNEVPLDPWGNEFIYRVPGANAPYTLGTLGADASEGGDGENADIFK
ncbi:MAG: hypothetical protein Tsb0010_04190 [Parvularculaceae bacterium]